jgi:lipid-binding SYLF domain-containing protein
MRISIWMRLALCLALVLVSVPAWAATTPADTEKLVADSGTTLENFTNDPDMKWFRDHTKDAKGMLICSQVVKAGFIIGGSGGRCVLVVKGDKGWNGPAFYTIATGSFGFQAGVQSAEIIALVMTQKALDSLMSKAFKLGGDASIAIGPVGTGAAATPKADFVFYARSKGVYGGVDVSGSSLKPTEDFNKVYYGKPASPIDIIVRGNVHNPQAEPALLSKVSKLYAGK